MKESPNVQPLAQAAEVDVLIWARIRASKRGSFEAYLLAMAEQCRDQNISIAIVLVEKTRPELMGFLGHTGAQVHELPDDCWMSAAVLKRVLTIFKPRLVHFHFYSAVSPLWAAARGFGATVYLSAHSSLPAPSHQAPKRLILDFIRKLRRTYYARKVDRFLPVSEFLANDLRRTSCDHRASVITIPNGVDSQRFIPPSKDERRLIREQLGLESHRAVIAFVGQLELHKGIQDFCAAMQSLADRYDLQVVIAGEGTQLSTMRERYPHWQWLGSVDNVQQVLQASDILVCPSRWQEAFGLVIAEAMACGVPVIGTDRGGIPEVISDRETGFLFPAGDVEAMCERITELLNDNGLWEQMSIAARERAVSMFALDDQVARTVDLYQRDLVEAA